MNIFVSISTKAYFVNVFNINCFWKVCEEVYVSEIVNLVTVAFHNRMQHQYWSLFLGFIFNFKFCEEFWAENNLEILLSEKEKIEILVQLRTYPTTRCSVVKHPAANLKFSLLYERSSYFG